MDLAIEKSADGEHHARRIKFKPHLRDDALDGTAVFDQIDHRLLEYRQAGLIFQFSADRHAIELTVGLSARRAYRRALAPIENPELDAGLVRGQRHFATERVDFLDQVALADAADSGIAGHLSEGFDAVRQQ